MRTCAAVAVTAAIALAGFTSPSVAAAPNTPSAPTNAASASVPDHSVAVLRAPRKFKGTLWPKRGRYGVGTIPRLTFNRPIPKKFRPSVVANLSVTTSPHIVTGAWRWLSPSEVVFRPARFWPGHLKVTVTAKLTALNVPGAPVARWGRKDLHVTWHTRRALVVSINSQTRRGKVKIDQRVVRRFPIGTGKPGFTTRSGIKTIMDKIRVTRMTNIGITEDEVYDLQVPYAMRLTASGEFMHAAPWHYNIGAANTSHGCTHLTMSDAAWIFSRASWGDPVITRGTGRNMEINNGPGALWNIPFKKFARGS